MPLDKNADAGEWVDDFYKSDAPQFKGKKKKKRRQMAIAAYLNKKNEGTMIKSNALKDLINDLTEGIRVEPLASGGRTSAEKAAGAGSHVAGGGRTDAEKAAGAGIKKRAIVKAKPKKTYTIQAGYDPSIKEAGWTDRKDPTPSGGDLKKKERAHKDAIKIHRSRGKESDHVKAGNAHEYALKQLNKVVMASPKSHKAFQVASDAAMKQSATAQPGFLPWQKGHPTHSGTPWKHLGRISSPPKDGPFAPRSGVQQMAPIKPTVRKAEKVVGIEKIKEEFNFEVDIEGLPKLFMYASGPGDVKAKLRKIVKQPSMINAVTRVTDATVRKTFRMKAQGKVDDKQDAYAESVLDEKVGPTLKLKDFKKGMYIQTKTGNVGKIIANEPRGNNLVVRMNKTGREVNMNWDQLGLYTKPRLKGLMHSRGRMGMR